MRRITARTAAAAALAASSALAQTVVYSTSFEQPTFTPGNLAPAVGLGQGNWAIDYADPAAVQVVSTGSANTGSQVVRINANPSSPAGGWAWYDPININPVASGTPIVTAQYSMYIGSGATVSGGWGMDVFASDLNFMGRVQVAGDNSVRVENGLAGFQNTGVNVARDSWVTYKLVFDFTTNLYDVFVNSVLAADNYGFTPQTGIIGDFDFRHNQQAAASDFALFDDYSITVAPAPSPSAVWNTNVNNSSWGLGANWSSGSAPNSASAAATLGTIITGARQVVLDQQITLDTLRINSPNAYTISGLPAPGSWAMRFAGTTDLALQVNAGSHVFLSPVLVTKNMTAQVDPGATIRFQSNFDTAGQSLNKTGGGTMRIRQFRGETLAVAAGTFTTTGGGTFPGTSVAKSLVIADGARLDLGFASTGVTTKFVVDYTGASPRGTLTSYLAAGKIVDATLAASNRAIGFAENADANINTLDDVTLDATSIVLRQTLRGDANLNLTVDIDDFGVLASNFNLPSYWGRGDFNYSGTTDIDDFGLLAANFNLSITPSAGSRTSIPEPTTALAAALLVLPRRRRR